VCRSLILRNKGIENKPRFCINCVILELQGKKFIRVVTLWLDEGLGSWPALKYWYWGEKKAGARPAFRADNEIGITCHQFSIFYASLEIFSWPDLFCVVPLGAFFYVSNRAHLTPSILGDLFRFFKRLVQPMNLR